MSKDEIKFDNGTIFTTLNGPETVATMLHLVSSKLVGNWKTSLTAMSEDLLASNIKSSIVLMVLKAADMQDSVLESFSKVVNDHTGSLLFHLIIATETKADWYQILKVRNVGKSVINLVQFDENGYIIEDYNLHGMTITSKENLSLHLLHLKIGSP